MTIKQIIDGLRFTEDMFLFDPQTGESKEYESLNDLDRITFDACEGAIKLLDKYRLHNLRVNPEDLPAILRYDDEKIQKQYEENIEDELTEGTDEDKIEERARHFTEIGETEEDYFVYGKRGRYGIGKIIVYMDGDAYSDAVSDEVVAWREVERFGKDIDE